MMKRTVISVIKALCFVIVGATALPAAACFGVLFAVYSLTDRLITRIECGLKNLTD